MLKSSNLRIWFLLVKQLLSTLQQSVKIAFKGKLKKAYYWFLVRNYVSLSGNGARLIQSEGPVELDKLRNDGFTELDSLSDHLVTSIIEYFLNAQKRRHSNLEEFFNHGREQNFVRSESVDICLDQELMKRILAELKILPIVTKFLGLSPGDIVMSAKVDALFRIEGKRNQRNDYDDALEFHRDIDSLRFVKAFTYLVDVGVGCGEHEVCSQSHKVLPIALRLIARQKLSTLKKLLPYFQLVSLTGASGYSWIEDTTTFHRGTIPKVGDRLILSLSFNDKRSATHLYENGFYDLSNYNSDTLAR